MFISLGIKLLLGGKKKSERLNLMSIDKNESIWRTIAKMNLMVFLDLA